MSSGRGEIHPTLARQLRRLGLDAETPPAAADWPRLLDRVSSSYLGADNDRYTLERAIEISSREMQTLHDDLAEREQFRSAIVDGAAEGFITVDAKGDIQSFNGAATRIFGWEEEEIVGRPLEILMPPAERPHHAAGFARYLETGQPTVLGRTVELEGLRRSGEPFPMLLSVSEVRVGTRRSFAGIVRDVSETKAMEAALHRQATQDTLTGLANRARLLEELGRALGTTHALGLAVGLLFIDLDRFKIVNDSLGHQAGDDLLVMAGRRISDVVRDGDLVARLGGDEFVVMCPAQRDERVILRIADRIHREFGRAFELGESEAFVSASIGIALSERPDTTAESLLRSADLAMYRAKKSGKNRYVLFDDEMQSWADHRLSLENALRRALSGGELDIDYQPIYRVDDVPTIVGAEALVRWRRPGGETVLPGAFLPLAEETGLIVDVGAFVLARAARELALWRETWPGRPLSIAVNLTARELQQPDLVQRVAATIDRYAIPPELLEIELTEATLISESEQTRRALDGLRRLGVRIVIDDFGTGFSSLSYLRRVPADVLKIDRSFTEEVDREESASSIVGAILSMGRAVGLDVVVEGIERDTQLQALRDLGAAAVQGYLLARPCPAAEIRALIAAGVESLDAAA